MFPPGLLLAALACAPARAQDTPGEDPRLGSAVTLDDHFAFTPPPDLATWERRRGELRRQVLVAAGECVLDEERD